MSVRFLNFLLYIRRDLNCPVLTIEQHGDPSKAAKYIAQLYEARSNGQWQDVPELARKVEKHAPSRKCTATSHQTQTINSITRDV